MNYLVRDRDVIFNLAGQVSHIDSMRDPYTDLEINCRSQLTILEACRHNNPTVKVVFAGTRQVYGRPDVAAGRRTSSRPADRRQRHQQGGGRVLPSRLQQRVRRPRLLAAADQRLRAAPADPTQPPGLHRLVHPSRHREAARFRSTATARSCATSSTSTMRPTRFCEPAPTTRCNGEVFNVGGTQPISHRDLAALLIDVAGTGSTSNTWTGRRRKRRSTSASFYADSSQVQRRDRVAAGGDARRGTAPHHRVLPRALRSLRRAIAGAARDRRDEHRADSVHVAGPRRGRGRGARRDRARDRAAAGSCSGPEVEAFEQEFADASRRRARRRRRQRHGRASR